MLNLCSWLHFSGALLPACTAACTLPQPPLLCAACYLPPRGGIWLQVRGFLEQGHNRFERPLLHGHWDSEMYADMPDGSTVSGVGQGFAVGFVTHSCSDRSSGRPAAVLLVVHQAAAERRASVCLANWAWIQVYHRLPDLHPPRPYLQVLLWRKNPPPQEPTRYNLTSFRCTWKGSTAGLALQCILLPPSTWLPALPPLPAALPAAAP